MNGGERLKLKALILLTLALFVFAAPVLVTVQVSSPKLDDALWNIVTNDLPPHPCGDPVEDPEIPH
jgi:hypothetical protein